MSDNTLLVEKILTALPQLQCKKCTYKDCLSYAQAVVSDDEDLNKCEPGGITYRKAIKKYIKK